MTWTILQGDALDILRGLGDGIAQTIITSPPYWTMVDYQVDGQLGLETTAAKHLDRLSEIFGEARRVLRVDGTLWLNYGDAYNTCNGGPGPNAVRSWLRKRSRMPTLITKYGLKTRHVKRKSLMGMPWRLAIRLEADGWYLRSEIIWQKPAPHENGRLDRPVRAHEHIFLLSRSERYYFDKSHRLSSIWTFSPEHVKGHPAPFPKKLAEKCILAGSRPGDLILDPFAGAGTTVLVALRHGRQALGIELSSEYVKLAKRRIISDAPILNHARD